MTKKKSKKQTIRGSFRKEVLDQIPDAEERFQEAFVKLTRASKKQVERRVAKAETARKKKKGLRARTIHKKPVKDRKKYHEARFL